VSKKRNSGHYLLDIPLSILEVSRCIILVGTHKLGQTIFFVSFQKKKWWINTCLVLQSKWCALSKAAIGRKTKSGRRKWANAVATFEKWIWIQSRQKPQRFISFIDFCYVVRKVMNESRRLHYSYFSVMKFKQNNGVYVDMREAGEGYQLI